MSACIGIIGGSGLDNPDLFTPDEEILPETPFGRPASPLRRGRVKGADADIILLSRHGIDHSVPPHKIDHRANMTALKDAGCTHVLATTACGSLREDLHPGALVVPDQFIDFTRRPATLFDRFENGEARHVVMADPFDQNLREVLLASARDAGLEAKDGGCVVSIAGPRFSTRAESRMFRLWGCDIINMTVAPECAIANEAGLPYAAMAMVTDYDCWDKDRPAMGFEEIMAVLETNVSNILSVLLRAIARLS